jgi:hypothetical protein
MEAGDTLETRKAASRRGRDMLDGFDAGFVITTSFLD